MRVYINYSLWHIILNIYYYIGLLKQNRNLKYSLYNPYRPMAKILYHAMLLQLYYITTKLFLLL